MAFTVALTGTAELDDSIVQEFDSQFIIAAAEMGIMSQLISYRRDIDAKSIEFPKYDQLGLATTPLVEVDDPLSEAIVDNKISLTPLEYGNVVTTTRLANLQTGGKADVAAARLVGMNMGRTLDKLAILAGEASTNEIFPDGVATEGALVAANVMDTTFLNELYNKLARANIMPLSDGMFVSVMHDDVIHDIRASVGDGSWNDINKFSNPDAILKNQVGEVSGFKVLRDNLISINVDAGDTAVDTYHTLCMGFNALGQADSQSAEMRMTGPFDKLARFINIGWIATTRFGIIDTDALFVGTTASSVGVNV